MNINTNEDITAGAILNRAAITGIELGAVSTAYMFAVQYLPQLISSAIAVTALTMPLWIAKFIGCILIIRAAMQRTADSYDGITRKHTLRLGIFAAIFSALIYSAANLASMLYISPAAADEAFDMIMGEYSKFLDSNAIATIDGFKENLPAMTFFSNLTYCILYGTVVSSILSRNIPKVDPFAGFRDSGNDVEEQ